MREKRKRESETVEDVHFFKPLFFPSAFDCSEMLPRRSQGREPAAQLPRRGARHRPLSPRASKPVPCAAASEKSNKNNDRSVEKSSGGKTRLGRSTFLLSLFAAGATLGPPLDGVHGAFNLLQYDLAPVRIGDSLGALHTSVTVPVLLGTFYAVSGFLHVLGDQFCATAKTSSLLLLLPLPPRRGAALAACALAVVAAHLALSALLYDAQVPAKLISLALFPSAFLIWLCLDRTPTGGALALATSVAAPLAELLLMNLLGVWHYPRADLFLASLGDNKGIISWVPACYAGYSVWIGALARWVAGEGRGEGEE